MYAARHTRAGLIRVQFNLHVLRELRRVGSRESTIHFDVATVAERDRLPWDEVRCGIVDRVLIHPKVDVVEHRALNAEIPNALAIERACEVRTPDELLSEHLLDGDGRVAWRKNRHEVHADSGSFVLKKRDARLGHRDARDAIRN